ncbi:MAG TPA: BTAD domain-containing putative transcriptional regulator [Gaiella sp.]|uniref:BTAD domain-containing putative transcriptional regulator n=1 Tax=Gaiella sp. TaxID=2663207 RepID=UPI002D80D8DE|nr:BTAD domain-containing putative transcriptional regulator [Gaiella sp.]HET9288490.1 BTAD domain-containing putative transcriptional regulator [Gaiella sp.]
MDFRILGPLEVDEGGRSVELGGARQRALLTILLLRRNEVVSADRLIEELYDGRPPPTAAKSLQAHVSRLRGALRPEDRLHTRPGGYVLEVAPDELDADRAARLVAEGRKARGAGDHDAAATSFASALGLWRGRPLADVAYDGFAQDEIARLDELRLECLEERLETDLERGRHAEVIGDLERLVAEHTGRERLRGQLMLALYRSGRQADALAAYQDARRSLLDELGIEPGRALQELERAILSQDRRLDAPASIEAPDRSEHPGRRAAGVFVGRERELADVLGAFDDARSGTGRLVLLTGEPGIGKSRLADELAAHAQARGTTVLWGRCWEAGGAPAYWPWVQALRSYVRDQDPETLRRQLGAGTSDLAHLLPDLRELFPDVPELHDLESEGARFRLFDAVATFLRNASEASPLVLVLDDLHVADEPSLLMLQFVASGIADARVTLLAIYRDPDPDLAAQGDVRLAELARAATVRIELGGLAEADVAAFVRSTAAVDPPTSVVDAIVHETEGNPLFVGEVVRLLAAEGQLDRPVHSSWRMGVPRGVREVIGRRLRHVSHECIDVLTFASVLGREFGLDALERLSDRPVAELLDLLDPAVSSRVVTDVPGAPGRLRFAHALIRDTLYDGLTKARRIELHRSAGEALESLYALNQEPHLTELAHHFVLAAPAGDALKAVELARRAGDQASQLLAHEEAARLYELALSALTLDPTADDTLECALHLALGDALSRAGDMAGAKDAFLRAAALARSLGDAESFARAAIGYGGRIVWARAGTDRVVVYLLEEALERLGDVVTPARARLLARLAGALRDERDPSNRQAIGELAVSIARETGDQSALAYAFHGLGAAYQASPDYQRRLDIAAELAHVAALVHDKEAQFDVNLTETLVYFELARLDAVRERVAAMSALAEELRQPSQLWVATAMRAMLALHEGRYAEAEELIPYALSLGRGSQETMAEVGYAIQLYELRREQGRPNEAHELLLRAAREVPARPVFRCALARLAIEIGRQAEGRRLFEELAPNDFEVVPRDQEWLLAASFLTDVCRALGDRPRAVALYDAQVPYTGRIAADVYEGSAGAVDRALGLLAAMLGRQDEAVARLDAAIELNEQTGAKPWAAYARVDLAQILVELGDEVRARTLRGEALATVRELGMTALESSLATPSD